MDLSTTYLGMRLPHPLIVGAGPARRRRGHGSRARRRRGLADRPAFAVRGRNHRRADGRDAPRREPQRVVPRVRQLRARVDNGARSRRIPRASPADQECRRNPGDGVAQRRHAGRLDLLRQADRGGRRRRTRAAHLPRRERYDQERGRRRARGDRDRARREAHDPYSDRHQDGAAPHGLRDITRNSSTQPGPTGSSCSRASTGSTSTSRSSK